VRKERAITRLVGSAWRRFITQNRIPAGVHLYFAMGAPGPRITVLYFNDEGGNEEGSDEEDSDEEGSYEEQGPLNSAIVAQRCKLTDSEENYLYDNYPPVNSFIRLSFVTRLTMTHTDLHTMVCFSLTILSSFPIIFVLCDGAY